MSAPTLPSGLTRWAAALQFLDPELAIALGPVVRTLDPLLAARVELPGVDGDPDGWAGLTRRGDPDRLLVSEWLLADELPEEFLRRAVASELLHLDPALRDEAPRGRLACVVDVGPDQLGAGRLVQLAAMVVLVRRAVAVGTTLRVGLLHGATVTWLDGPFDVAATAWLRARTAVAPEPDAVRGHLDAVDTAPAGQPAGRPDEVWLLCGPDLAAHLPGRARTVVIEPGEWDDDGLRTMRVRVEHRVVTVTLPEARVSVRALRGTGFAKAPDTRPVQSRSAHASGLRWPSFPGAGRRLVGRGADDRTLVSTVVDPRQRSRPKQHGFGAPVLAAGTAGPRLITLLGRDDGMEVHVVGRPLEGLHGLRLPRHPGPTDSDGPLEPLVLVDRQLLWRNGGVWWQITAGGIAVADAVVAVGWSNHDSSPRVVRRDAWPTDLPATARDAAALLLGPDRTAAWTHDHRAWQLHHPLGDHPVLLEEGETPLGLAVVGERLGLVTQSASGLVVRFRASGAAHTFTRLSGAGAAGHRALHPTRPWLVVTRGGSTEVEDLDADTVVQRVPGS